MVGLFAGLAEVCATVVFLKLDGEMQHAFVWFVMGFPILLVFAFFLTLNFNSKVFYAPTDFTSDDAFLRVHGIPTPDPAPGPKRTKKKTDASDATEQTSQ